MLKIGDFSKLSRLSIRMLRHYDEIGLLTPASIDPFTGYRYYSEAQLAPAGRIAALRDMGFGLTDIIELLRCTGDTAAWTRFLLLRREALRQHTRETARQLRLVDTALTGLRKDDRMQYEVNLKQLPARTVASVRQILPSYEYEGRLWHVMMKETNDMRLQDADPCYTFAIFHNGEFKEADVDVEVQKTVVGAYQNTEHVVFKTEPPVQFASAVYQGGYDKINQVNQDVANWVEKNGYEYAGPAFNIYHVSPHETQNPDEYVTEVCYPVCKK